MGRRPPRRNRVGNGYLPRVRSPRRCLPQHRPAQALSRCSRSVWRKRQHQRLRLKGAFGRARFRCWGPANLLLLRPSFPPLALSRPPPSNSGSASPASHGLRSPKLRLLSECGGAKMPPVPALPGSRGGVGSRGPAGAGAPYLQPGEQRAEQQQRGQRAAPLGAQGHGAGQAGGRRGLSGLCGPAGAAAVGLGGPAPVPRPAPVPAPPSCAPLRPGRAVPARWCRSCLGTPWDAGPRWERVPGCVRRTRCLLGPVPVPAPGAPAAHRLAGDRLCVALHGTGSCLAAPQAYGPRLPGRNGGIGVALLRPRAPTLPGPAFQKWMRHHRE